MFSANEVQAVERSYQSTASWLLGYFTGSQVTNREGGYEGHDRIYWPHPCCLEPALLVPAVVQNEQETQI